MPTAAKKIRVNHAPVLTLWATVVAERLGQEPEAAITLGCAVAASSARVTAKAIGIEEDGHGKGDLRDAASNTHGVRT